MIFAGDFAQLPPVPRGPGSSSLYSAGVGTQHNSGNGIAEQEASIGKALWHQVTTVVILRENMRQKSQTPDDAKLRTALENMRYKDCTQDDINFLMTRVAGTVHGRPRLGDKQFRNTAIITGINVHKDRINELGCERFAADTNQTLTHFYSKDEMKDTNQITGNKRRGRPKK
ncbi:hypothetical protein PLICRDRAFT_71588, partial [Plicaturopsis crispa FD-325 SS-3]